MMTVHRVRRNDEDIAEMVWIHRGASLHVVHWTWLGNVPRLLGGRTVAFVPISVRVVVRYRCMLVS